MSRRARLARRGGAGESEDAHRYCADLVAPPGSSLHYSLLFETPARRRAVVAIHALTEALRDVAGGASEASIAQRKLGWWAEELDALTHGTARHPVSRAIALSADVEALAPAFAAMLEAAERAVRSGGFARLDELERFAQGLGGQAGMAEQRACADDGGSPVPAAARIGKALELAQVFRPGSGGPLELAWMLPGDVLARAGVEEAGLGGRDTPEALRSALGAIAERVEALLEPSPPTADGGRHGAGLARSLAARRRMALATLAALRRGGFAVMERRIGITPLRKLWIAWREAG